LHEFDHFTELNDNFVFLK